MELHALHKEKGGLNCNRSRLVGSFREIMGNQIMRLSSPGAATILSSKSKAPTVLRLGKVNRDDFDLQVNAVAGKIAAETKTLCDKILNYSNIDRENISAFRETLLDLLSHISPSLKKCLSRAMICSINTRHINNETNYALRWVRFGGPSYTYN